MARMGGLFPFPIANVSEGGTRIALTTGASWFPPSGQYLFITDANSVVQFWDAQNQSWQTLLGHSSGGAFTVDGANYRVLNDSGTLTIATVTPGTSANLANGIGPLQNGITASVTAGTQAANNMAPSFFAITGGAVAVPTVTQPGTGFLAPPLIVIDPPPAGGQQAVAHATLTAIGGGIASIVIDNPGAGYLQSPNFWIVPQPNYYIGGPSGGIPAATFPPPGTISPNNALSGLAGVATGALLTPVALTGAGTITGVVIVNRSGGWSGVAPTSVLTLGTGFSGTIGTAAFTVTVGTAAAVSLTIVAPRVVE